MIDRDAGQHVDQQVTLDGVAMDAFSGAVVMLADNIPIYVDGLDEWDDALFKKRLHVSGTLRRRQLGADPGPNAKGEYSHGKFGAELVIEDATWVVAG
jgi:hypothetical protein